MNAYHNAAHEAVQAAACPDTGAQANPQDVYDCIATGLPREQWTETIAQAEPCQSLAPLVTTPVEQTTNTEARRLVDEVRSWAGQFNAPDAKALVHAMDDMERLLVSAWTEVDEALCLLHMANHDQSTQNADKRRATAMEYLHKWQDRGGRMGNCG